ncbi:MAG: hypothetical protein ACRDYU_04055, partial [Actinomycetes bacterium]
MPFVPPSLLRRHRPRTVLAVGTVLAATLALTVPAVAEPSPEDIRRQREKAARLDDEAAGHQKTVDRARTELARRAARAADALEAYHKAQQRSLRTSRSAEAAEQRLVDARAEVSDTHRTLGRYASNLYRTTGGSTQLANLTGLLDSGSPTEFTRRLGTVQWVGDQQSVMFRRQKEARADRQEASVAAEAALARARAAQRSQRSAKRRADHLVGRQRELLERRRDALARAEGAAEQARARA